MFPDAWISSWLLWFLAAIAFATLELFLPIFIFLFFGIGCLGVALALLVFDIPLSQQLAIFIIVTIFSLVMLRKWMMGIFRGVTADRTDKDFDDFPYGERVQVLRDITPPQPGRIQHRELPGTPWLTILSRQGQPSRLSVMPVNHAKHFTFAKSKRSS